MFYWPVTAHVFSPALTKRDDKESQVSEPVGGFMCQVIHKQTQNNRQVMLSSCYSDPHRRRCDWVTVTTREKEKRRNKCIVCHYPGKLETKWQKYEEEMKCLTHNLCMREMMVLNAACMSAVVHVHTTGRPWFCNTSDTYWHKKTGRGLHKWITTSQNLQLIIRHHRNCHVVLTAVNHTWPCQSEVLMRMMLSGRWLSDTRMWFSWS